MHDPRDIVSISTGVVTAGIGGLTMVQVQNVLGIVAALAGIALTFITFLWRRKEHYYRMGIRPEKDKEKRDETR